MKKVSLICFVAAICYLTSVVSAYAGWPINRTLPIEGTITDATTGEPIENVIISCEWWKDVFGIVDSLQQTFSEKLVVTGKDGRYKIPAKISLHIISKFKRVEISVRHPLYEMKEFWAWNKGMYVRKGEWVEAKDGKIYLDIKLLSLEEKYREIDRTKGRNGLPIQIYDLDHEMIDSKYFYQAKELGVNKNQLNNFILALEKIVEIGKYSVEEKDYLKDRLKKSELWLREKGLL